VQEIIVNQGCYMDKLNRGRQTDTL